jgi:hypothetical protein
MQNELSTLITKLGVAEKDTVEKNFLDKLQIWARLIDEVENGLKYIEDIPNETQNFTRVKQEYQNILKEIERLDIGKNASRVSNIQSSFNSFKQQHYEKLLGQKQKITAATENTSDIAALRKVVDDAKKQKAEFEKSFKESLEKQATGSQRILASHFSKRLEELKKKPNTNPDIWLGKRSKWFYALTAALLILIGIYTVLAVKDIIGLFEPMLITTKLAIITALYLQYHFASRNYHIYADMVAKYEHLAVIAETMTDFTATSFDNEELNSAVYKNAAKTLFGAINTEHAKSESSSEATLVENIINQIPKSS